jgi:two-component system NarL family response regulator
MLPAANLTPADPIKLLIVDDHPVVRDGLAAIISSEPDLQVVGTAGTGEAALQAYFELRPSITIMDLLLPDIPGAEVIQRICNKSPSALIIVLTTLSGDEEIYRALEAGARGYLLKDMVRRELVQAIREVQSGRRYLPDRVGTKIAESLPRSGLTSRETEVLQLIASGLRNKEVAYRLDVSEATINAHLKHIYSKLNASDRTHAVVLALRRGIIRL